MRGLPNRGNPVHAFGVADEKKDPDEIELRMEVSEDSRQFALILEKEVGPITIPELILELECYLLELARTVSAREKPGTKVH